LFHPQKLSKQGSIIKLFKLHFKNEQDLHHSQRQIWSRHQSKFKRK